jgi:hypothetical protein
MAIVPASSDQHPRIELVVKIKTHFRRSRLTALLNGRLGIDHQPVHVEDDGSNAHDARMLPQSSAAR